MNIGHHPRYRYAKVRMNAIARQTTGEIKGFAAIAERQATLFLIAQDRQNTKPARNDRQSGRSPQETTRPRSWHENSPPPPAFARCKRISPRQLARPAAVILPMRRCSAKSASCRNRGGLLIRKLPTCPRQTVLRCRRKRATNFGPAATKRDEELALTLWFLSPLTMPRYLGLDSVNDPPLVDPRTTHA